MVFTEREAIRQRMATMANEKERLYERQKKLDEEYSFYINRLHALDENSPVVDEFGVAQSDNEGLQQYDLDALKEGLTQIEDAKAQEADEPSEEMDETRRGKQFDLRKVAGIVEDILVDYGEPMEIRKLRRMLEEKGLRWKYFWPTLTNIMKHSGHLEKPARGFISYIPKASEDHPGTPEDMTDIVEYAKGRQEAATAEEDAEEDADIREAAEEVPDSAYTEEDEPTPFD